MSWFFKTLQSNDDLQSPHPHTAVTSASSPERSSSGNRHGGSAIKDDVSSLFRGVANFLAPPPSSSSAGNSVDSSSRSLDVDGIRNDLAEIGGTFKSSLSLLSSNKVVTGISEFASQLILPEGQALEDDQGDDNGEGDDRNDGVVPGTTDEVVRFVREISRRPECWIEFPSPLDHDFSMSNSQREHVLTIERLVPELVSLRLNLCSYMNVEKFWMIYFLLLLPRLDQRGFECLSTPKIVEARDALLQKLGEKRDCQIEERDQLSQDQEHREDIAIGRENIPSEKTNTMTEKRDAAKGLQIDDTEDISFSDLEDDGSDLSDRTSSHRRAQDTRGSSPDGSSDWVQLSENSERGGSRRQAAHSKGWHARTILIETR
ncbi:uncharacterized protein LOC114713442 isoform X2 [Neltuma alba]|uniref:uncharacterized protein LOC114713442 isoform X2 n=1 Tax=Neltuma alba TaxID=207710 RepID=UPI0010A3AC4F|nr:uncharacterized protein LOC114713442 isoform X2 [Prosopis alba]